MRTWTFGESMTGPKPGDPRRVRDNPNQALPMVRDYRSRILINGFSISSRNGECTSESFSSIVFSLFTDTQWTPTSPSSTGPKNQLYGSKHLGTSSMNKQISLKTDQLSSSHGNQCDCPTANWQTEARSLPRRCWTWACAMATVSVSWPATATSILKFSLVGRVLDVRLSC